MNNEIDIMPKCRECPSFEIFRFRPCRYIAVCHAKEGVLYPIFSEKNICDCYYMSKANIDTAQFKPLDNCTYVNKLRNEGLIPWADGSIDFSKE